jgi:hypothetical protein
VARIFADISDEISFVPLRGPLNRDESGGRPVWIAPENMPIVAKISITDYIPYSRLRDGEHHCNTWQTGK